MGSPTRRSLLATLAASLVIAGCGDGSPETRAEPTPTVQSDGEIVVEACDMHVIPPRKSHARLFPSAERAAVAHLRIGQAVVEHDHTGPHDREVFVVHRDNELVAEVVVERSASENWSVVGLRKCGGDDTAWKAAVREQTLQLPKDKYLN